MWYCSQPNLRPEDKRAGSSTLSFPHSFRREDHPSKTVHRSDSSIVRMIISKDDIRLVYLARKDRLTNPTGEFDNAGRWYPSDDENADKYTSGIRRPSRKWPYSYMLAARTLKHSRNLALLNPKFFRTLVEEAARCRANDDLKK